MSFPLPFPPCPIPPPIPASVYHSLQSPPLSNPPMGRSPPSLAVVADPTSPVLLRVSSPLFFFRRVHAAGTRQIHSQVHAPPHTSKRPRGCLPSEGPRQDGSTRTQRLLLLCITIEGGGAHGHSFSLKVLLIPLVSLERPSPASLLPGAEEPRNRALSFTSIQPPRFS